MMTQGCKQPVTNKGNEERKFGRETLDLEAPVGQPILSGRGLAG